MPLTDLEKLAINYVKHRGTAQGPAHWKKLRDYVNRKILAPQRYEQEKPQVRRKAA